MVRHGVVAFVAVAAVAGLDASPRGQTAERQQSADYAAAVQAYVTGHDAAAAARPLGAWTARQWQSAVERFLERTPQTHTAAATLHLEIAVGVIMMSAPDLAARHLELGHRIMTDYRKTAASSIPARSAAETSAFAERWYVAAASTFLMVNDPVNAAPYIERGLQVSARSSDLRLMRGILDEMNAISLNTDESRSAAQLSRMLLTRTQVLTRAKGTYQKLLADEPRFTRARIRLGRVLWMLDERDTALAELLRAQSEAREPAQRYLVAMFLGALYEQSGNLTGARIAYEAALAAAPRSQAATVGLGHLDVMEGRPDRAQALARQLLSKPPVGDEWWSYKNGGFEMAALVWLREQVWR